MAGIIRHSLASGKFQFLPVILRVVAESCWETTA